MASDKVPRVYADADVFLHVLMNQEHAADSEKVLAAAKRKVIKLIASRLLTVEVGGWGGGRPGPDAAAEMLEDYLDSVETEWVELDVVTAREAVKLSWQYRLRASDAVHLATAVRREADYFMSYDERFPYGERVGRTLVMHPDIVWEPIIGDTDYS